MIKLVGQHLATPALTLKQLERLTPAQLEQLFKTIWTESLKPTQKQTAQSQILSLFLLIETLTSFQKNALVADDLDWFHQQAQGLIHGAFLKTQTPKALIQLLAQHQSSTGYTHALEKGDSLLGYLLDRTLTSPLPWAALLEQLDPESLESLPFLRRFQAIHQQLIQEQFYETCVLDPNHIEETYHRLKHWLDSSLKDRLPSFGVVRPVRHWVIVEGVTEEILIPAFARLMGVDLVQEGILVQSAGGKNQVYNLYQRFADALAIPVLVVLD